MTELRHEGSNTQSVSDQGQGQNQYQSLRQPTLPWQSGMWFALGGQVIMIVNLGGIANLAGNLSYLIWFIGALMAFCLYPVISELTGMFPGVHGGGAIFGGLAYSRYSRALSSMFVMGGWMGWGVLLAVGASIISGMTMNVIAPFPTAKSAVVQSWFALRGSGFSIDNPEHLARAIADNYPEIRRLSFLDFNLTPLHFALNFNFFLGVFILFFMYALQHRGLKYAAMIQRYLAPTVFGVMFLCSLWAILTGRINPDNLFTDLYPPNKQGSSETGTWNIQGVTLIFSALFIVPWLNYIVEATAVFAPEIKDLQKNMRKMFLCLLCIVLTISIIVPIVYQGVLGWERTDLSPNGMITDVFIDGTGMTDYFSILIGSNTIFVTIIFTLIMMMLLFYNVSTGLEICSRISAQAAIQGWWPRFLKRRNIYDSPNRSIWLNLIVNIIILGFINEKSDISLIIGISNVGYFVYMFFLVNSVWIHRLDAPDHPRPYRAKNWQILAAIIFGFVNLLFLGAGSEVWHRLALPIGCGIIVMAGAMTWFVSQRQINDTEKSLYVTWQPPHKRAGFLIFLVFSLAIAMISISNWVFNLT
ncbi:MAG: amino acid permease [Alphaproteobacteria bacterium]|nr:amino acid permease [Alphaproteobacteria bacterium]